MKLLLFFHYFLEVFKNSFAMKTSSFVMKISLYANILQINVYIEETHTDPKKTEITEYKWSVNILNRLYD